jgi:hypothetical protein
MINFLLGMLVMYLISYFFWQYEDLFAPSGSGWYTPLPDFLYKPITIFLAFVRTVFVIITHPIIVIKYYSKKIKKLLDK